MRASKPDRLSRLRWCLLSPRASATVAWMAVLLAALGLPGPPGWAASGQDFVFPELNRRYEQLTPEMIPVSEGSLSVGLESPQNQLDLLGHRLTLTPGGDGTHDAVITLDFQGEGSLIAHFDLGGAISTYRDELVVPRQEREIPARVRITPTADGYAVTIVELPSEMRVAIESQLGSRVVAACLPLSALGLVPVSCTSLDRAFSQVRLPLPGAGETYLFETEQLSPESRRLLDAYLSSAR